MSYKCNKASKGEDYNAIHRNGGQPVQERIRELEVQGSPAHVRYDLQGVHPRPAAQREAVKRLCSAPSCDRHFKVTESFGFELITIFMAESPRTPPPLSLYSNNRLGLISQLFGEVHTPLWPGPVGGLCPLYAGCSMKVDSLWRCTGSAGESPSVESGKDTNERQRRYRLQW